MPGDKYASIQNPRQYRALRRRGFSKEAAARISNARTPGHAVKDSGVTGLAIPPTGPNALFNSPGIGIRSARRRRRLKAFNWGAHVGQVISGGLTRGEGGRFAGSGQPSARSQSSAAQKKRREETRAKRQARADARMAAREQELAQEDATRADEDAYVAAGTTGAERQRRRAEIAAKRRERAAQRRERRRQEAETERQARQQEDEAEAKTREEEQAKAESDKGGKGGGGGGGGKKKPTDEEKKAAAEQKKAENRAKTAPQAGLSTDEAEFLAGAASGTLPNGSFDASHLRELGLVEDTGDTTEATDAGRRLLAALEKGDVRAALAAIQDGKAQVARDQAKRERDQQRQPKKQLPPTRGDQKPDPRRSPGQLPPGQRPGQRPPVSTMPVRPDPAVERERNQVLAQRIIRNLEERRNRRRRGDNRGIGGITNVERSNRSQRTTKAKAKRERTADEEKAMFAAMGARGGSGGGGSGGGESKLWPKGPDGKRTPQAAGAETRAEDRQGITIEEAKQRDTDIRQARSKAESRLEDALARGNYARADEIRKQIDTYNQELKDLEKAHITTPVAGQTVAQHQREQRAEYRRQADRAADEARAAGQKLREAEEHARTLSVNQVPHSHIDNLRRDYETKKRRESELRDLGREKAYTPSFAIFKDAAGRDRWASITTTAYQDKDQEWISCKAIRAVVAAGDSGAPRGPLRFWHVPGMDLGDCDYQATLGDGRMLLESGTFRSKAAARIGAEAARRGYQMSPGFVHTRQEPRGGVFDSIALFERSFVPPGRASNPYTRLLTKELRMLTEEKKKEFEALAGDTEGRALLQSLLAQAETTTKAADQAGAVYKDAPPWAQALIARLDALETTVKASMDPASMMDAGATEEDDALTKMDADMGMGDGEPEGDEGMLDDAGFADLIVQKLMAAIGPMLELEKKMTGYLGEMKAMLQPQTAKDDARAKEIAELQARLKSLEGDQPRAARASWNAQTWEAIAGAGIPVTKEQAAVLATQQTNPPPAGLSSPIEIAAHKALWGDS